MVGFSAWALPLLVLGLGNPPENVLVFAVLVVRKLFCVFSRNSLSLTCVPLVWLCQASEQCIRWQPFKYLKKIPLHFLVRVLVFKMKNTSVSSIVPQAGGVVLVPSSSST